MMELLPYHQYKQNTKHKHCQQIIQKITRLDTDSKLHIKIITDCIRGLLWCNFIFRSRYIKQGAKIFGVYKKLIISKSSYPIGNAYIIFYSRLLNLSTSHFLTQICIPKKVTQICLHFGILVVLITV